MTRIKSEVLLVSDILCSGRFEVPWHQRYYDWSKEEVEALLFDLENALAAGSSCYFLGSIMLVDPPSSEPALAPVRRINDGQQRLITLSLMISAFCRRFAQPPRDSGHETLALRALFDRPDNRTSRLDDASKYQPRIEPPRENWSNYLQIIRGYDIGTNGPLTTAWNRIDGFVQGMNKPKRKKFFDFLMRKVEISVLDIPSDVDANSVFESLNARGKPLDDVDLIRNRLYSYFSETEDAARRKEVHEKLEAPLVIIRSQKKTEQYFRCYMQCRYGYLQQTRFYRSIRVQIEKSAPRRNPSGYVYNLVAGLGRRDSIELFRTITSSSVSPSLEKCLPSVSGKRNLTVLLRELRKYTVSHPIVFALLHRFIREEDQKEKRKTGKLVMRSLKNLGSFVLRTAFVSPKFEPSKFEDAFADCARDVFAGSSLKSLDIMDDLERNDEWGIIEDENFIRLMSTVEFRKDTQRPIRFLFGINAREQPGADAVVESKCSLEHVLPVSETHWGGWSGFNEDDPGMWVYRTGNMLVVPKDENRADAEYNGSFDAKKRTFAGSMLKMSRTLAENYDEWTPRAVEERSRLLAEQAAQTWKFRRSGPP